MMNDYYYYYYFILTHSRSKKSIVGENATTKIKIIGAEVTTAGTVVTAAEQRLLPGSNRRSAGTFYLRKK